jgi:predicted transposase YbfD/YdcC
MQNAVLWIQGVLEGACVMVKTFLDHIGEIKDPRIPGMVHYPLSEILLVILVGFLCRAEDFDEMEYLGIEELQWLRTLLPFAQGVAPAQTMRRTLARLNPRQLELAFSGWVSDLVARVRGVIAIDGKTLRGSKHSADGTGALHLVQAYAHEAGLVLASCATCAKSNEITAIPELLKLIDIHGAIITIDAMGTQKAIARTIIKGCGDYVLALKGNQGSLHDDVAAWFADPALVEISKSYSSIETGHGRIEERTILAADAKWLAKRHPDWPSLTSIVAVRARRTNKKSGAVSCETRLYIASLPPDPEALADAIRAHWSIENNLHWTLDVAFHEDQCRIRKDHAPQNLAMIRRIALNMLKREPSKMPVKRKRLKAMLDTEFRSSIFAC